jgi:hypothetical protein
MTPPNNKAAVTQMAVQIKDSLTVTTLSFLWNTPRSKAKRAKTSKRKNTQTIIVSFVVYKDTN